MGDNTANHPWLLSLSLAKRWSKEFSNEAHMPKDDAFVEELESFDSELEGVELFMEPYTEKRSFDVEALIQFCRGILVTNLNEQAKRGSAWLDDRSYASSHPEVILPLDSSSISALPPLDTTSIDQGISRALSDEFINHSSDGCIPPGVVKVLYGSDQTHQRRYTPGSRRYPAPLTAAMLYDHLSRQRYNHPHLPDSDRRLVAIANPDGFDIIAVTHSAPHHLQEALRDVLTRYISLRPALRIKLSDYGFPTYQLEIHLPHFQMRKQNCVHTMRAAKPHRERIDLSFLVKNLPAFAVKETPVIEQAQISIVLCGTTERRYTVYCFEDNGLDEDREMGDDEFSEDGVQVDQVVKGDILDANLPLWNPREYFMVILFERVKQVNSEWANVVQMIESAFNNFCANRGSHPFAGGASIASYWTSEMLRVIGRLLRTIRDTIKLWQTFVSTNGDIAYYSDLVAATDASKTRIERTLHGIHGSFEEMSQFQEKLNDIQAECEKLQHSFEGRLMLEAYKNTELTILYICPITVVSTFFAIPTNIFTFERNVWSFIGGIFLIMAAVFFLQIVVGGRLHQQLWWRRLTRHVRALWQRYHMGTGRDGNGTRVRAQALANLEPRELG